MGGNGTGSVGQAQERCGGSYVAVYGGEVGVGAEDVMALASGIGLPGVFGKCFEPVAPVVQEGMDFGVSQWDGNLRW